MGESTGNFLLHLYAVEEDEHYGFCNRFSACFLKLIYNLVNQMKGQLQKRGIQFDFLGWYQSMSETCCFAR